MIFLHFLSSWQPISNQSYIKKPTPSQINLMKNAKNHFLLLKKFKNTEIAQLCTQSCENSFCGSSHSLSMIPQGLFVM